MMRQPITNGLERQRKISSEGRSGKKLKNKDCEKKEQTKGS
jgi:hypothetical protein